MSGEQRCVYLYPIDLRKPNEPLLIPLRANDDPVKLPIQRLIQQAYRTGRYDQSINYAKPPEPPLVEANATWPDALLKSTKKR